MVISLKPPRAANCYDRNNRQFRVTQRLAWLTVSFVMVLSTQALGSIPQGRSSTDGTIPLTWNGIRAQDDIVLIDTRSAGCSCNPVTLMTRIRCQRLVHCEDGSRRWQPSDVQETLHRQDLDLPTVIFVHGNRVSRGEDKSNGLMVYRRMSCCRSSEQPIRFIIFSWPASEIHGPLRDARVKAARTRPVGCQLAWVVDQLPGEIPLGLIGYSYGARVITGALHLLGDGQLSGLTLSTRNNPERAPVKVVMLASALHAHWLGPGQYHGNAMSQVRQMRLVNNRRDRVMRWYHLSSANSSPQALGLKGPTCIGEERTKIRCCDVSRSVGGNHDLRCYLSAPGVACQLAESARW